jgi:hypothetical protein
MAPFGQEFKRLQPCWCVLQHGEKQKNPPKRVFGAVEKTRTSTGCPTATSTLRVYQFRHDRIVVEAGLLRRGACSKSVRGAQERYVRFFKIGHRSQIARIVCNQADVQDYDGT